jgi:5-methylcytosine-specific restriction endonuclease McrA
METTFCKCGCGSVIPAFAKNGKPRVYLHGHQNRQDKDIPLIPCACGCGTLIPALDRKNRPARYFRGHQGRIRSEAKRKASTATLAAARSLGSWNKGRSYVIAKRITYATKGSWMAALRRIYGDTCMRCGWNLAVCDAHHITPRSSGGQNTLDNGIILCPNCHRLANLNLISIDELLRLKAIAPILVESR